MKKIPRKRKITSLCGLLFAAILVLMPVCPVYGAHWAEPSLNYAVINGLLPPMFTKDQVEQNFDKQITREELATVLVFALSESVKEDNINVTKFTDKDSITESMKSYVAAANRLGIFAGVGVGNSDEVRAVPQKGSTREEAATMIARALGLSYGELSEFKDDGDIELWAKNAVAGMKKSGVILGNGNNCFMPKDGITWGQMMSIVEKASQSGKLASVNFKVEAGDGVQGHANGSTAKSRLYLPMGITRDSNGVIYFSDNGNNLIRTISGGKVEDYAGIMGPDDIYNMSVGDYVDGDKSKAVFKRPLDVHLIESGLLVADSGNNAIRLVGKDKVTTYAGSKTPGYKDGDRKTALFNCPSGFAIDNTGNIYVSDSLNHVIRKIDKQGMVTTVAGTPQKSGFQDGDGKTALLCEPVGIVYKDGSLYIADSGNQRIRVLKDGKLTTLAGGGSEKQDNTNYILGDYLDGEALDARFDNPRGLSFDYSGNLFIADEGNGMIRKYANGKVSTFVGFGEPINTKGPKLGNYLQEPCSVLALEKRLIVTDTGSNCILSFPYSNSK